MIKKLLIKRKASITVFMTLIFLIILSLMFAAIETLRFQSSAGYMRTAAENSAVTVYGNYVSELYTDYHLFAYGGFDGTDDTDLSIELKDCLLKNLKFSPDNSTKKYSSFYQFKNADAQVTECAPVSDPDNFYRQMRRYASGAGLKNTLEILKNAGSRDSDDEKLRTAEITHAGREALQEERTRQENEKKESSESGTGDKKAENNRSSDEKGNPIKTFNKIMKNGILSLVCNPESLSDEKIVEDEDSDRVAGNKEDDILSDYRNTGKSENDDIESGREIDHGFNGMDGILESSKKLNMLSDVTLDRAAYIIWNHDMMANYLNKDSEKKKAQTEYVISGKNTEKDCVLSVMYRILLMRMGVNLTCVASDPEITARASATAGTVATAAGLPFLEEAVKALILAIYATEESVVDTRAVFEGRSIPIVKKKSDLKLSYTDIFTFSGNKAKEKASLYKKADESCIAAGSLTYRDFLDMMLISADKEKVSFRSCMIVQQDLREKYNSSFNIDETTASFTAEITYTVPFIYTGLAGKGARSFFSKGGSGVDRKFIIKRKYR